MITSEDLSLAGRSRGASPQGSNDQPKPAQAENVAMMDLDDSSEPKASGSPSPGNGKSEDAAARRRIFQPIPPRSPTAGRSTEDEDLLNRPVPPTPRAKAP